MSFRVHLNQNNQYEVQNSEGQTALILPGAVKEPLNGTPIIGTDHDSIMLDVETLGTEKNALMLSVGFIFFDSEGRLGDECHYYTINPTGFGSRAEITQDTIDYWKDERRVGNLPDLSSTINLDDFCRLFSAGIAAKKKLTSFWSRGQKFDYEIINYWCNAVGVGMPIPFYKQLDVRTALWLGQRHGCVVDKRPVKHNALDDSKEQLRQLRCVL